VCDIIRRVAFIGAAMQHSIDEELFAANLKAFKGCVHSSDWAEFVVGGGLAQVLHITHRIHQGEAVHKFGEIEEL
jgi:hypothetical protein